MIVTRMALPRRTFLRGMGATFALPLLDAMVPAFSATLKSAAAPVTRMGFVYVPNGVAMNDVLNFWTPKGAGTRFEFSPILAPLAPYRDRLTIVSGLAQKQGNHSATATANIRARARRGSLACIRRRPKAQTSGSRPLRIKSRRQV